MTVCDLGCQSAMASALIANRTTIGPWKEFDLIHNCTTRASPVARSHASGSSRTASVCVPGW
jgi:hypothetical protein